MGTWDTPSHAAPEAKTQLEHEPVAVFQINSILEGWIPRHNSRVSDGLNAAERMRVQTATDDGGPGDWIDLDLDEVIAVAVAPRPPSPARVSGRLHAVEVRAGPYRVSGTAHMPLGADPSRFVGSTSRRWLPLTGCTVATAVDEWAVDVVIVNLDHASRRPPSYSSPPFG